MCPSAEVVEGVRRRGRTLAAIGRAVLALGVGVFVCLLGIAYLLLSPQAGPSDLPKFERRLRGLVAAIEQFTVDNGRPPSRLADLVPKYLDAIPKPLRYTSTDLSYFVAPSANLKPNDWKLLYWCGPAILLDSAARIEYNSTECRWQYFPDD
jgi:hypothetical protein